MAAKLSSRTTVYAALAGNVLVALTKTGAAMWTGSAAMLSEAIHSWVDSGNQVLLLYGMRRSAQRADAGHPLGYGRELYFWSFIVALLIFALGGLISLYQGVVHLRAPEPIRHTVVNYVVLTLAALFEGSSWLLSLRQFREVKGAMSYYAAFRRSKDPPSFMVLFEDTAALIGIGIAALATFLATRLQMPEVDGIASMLIGVLLIGVSILLARESKSLLIGERADSRVAQAIMDIAADEPGVERANGVLTVQLAPDAVVAALSLHFAGALTAKDVETAVANIEQKVRSVHPQVLALFVKPQSAGSYEAAVRRRFGSG
jgi:cation diffusion facilitator family transporter